MAAWALVFLALAGAAVWGVGRLVNASAGLRVAHVVVTGNTHVSTGEVLSRLTGVVGSSLLTLDMEAYRASLRSSPWVADVTMRRVLPDTLQVRVTERRPLAIARTGAALVLVDAEGAVIDEFGPNYEGFDLPIIDGLAKAASASGAAGTGARARVTARLLTDLSGDERLLRRVSQVDVTDPQNVVVWLQDDTTRLLLGDREFRKRLAGYVEVREALRARVPEIDAVDLRFDRRLFVRPAQERPAGPGRTANGRQAQRPS